MKKLYSLFMIRSHLGVGLFLVFLFITPSAFAQPPQRHTPERNLPQETKQQLTLKGCLKTPRDWKNIPEFRFFYDGKEAVNDNEGFFTFPIEENINKFNIIICKDIKQNFDGINTIENLSVRTDKPYLMYSLKRTLTKYLEKKGFIVPQNCLVAVINPKYIEEVKPWDIKLSGNFVKLPQIILKSDIKEKRIKREAAKSVLRSLDSVPFHERIKTTKKDDKGITISLTQAEG
jgi:hypothetical protein